MQNGQRDRSRGRYIAETVLVIWYLYAPHRSIRSHPDISPAPADLAEQCRRRANELGIETVDVLIWDHPFVNAVPVGTTAGGTLVLSTGLLSFLDGERLDAAIVHELAHIRRAHDRRFAAIVGMLGCVVLAIAPLFRRNRMLGAVGPPLLGLLAAIGILALVRRYERQADEAALEVLEDPRTLANAILAVQTGDRDVDIAAVTPRSRSAARRLFQLYPRAEDRFPRLLGPDG